MWGTDMTQTVTFGEGRAYVFIAVEHANSEIVGIHAALRPIASRRWSRCVRV
jgi:putative transposase